MSASFETPSYEALVAEQAEVQAQKFQGRQLAEYSSCIFPGQDWREPQNSAVADFVRPLLDGAERVTLEGVLEGLHAVRAEKHVRWVDMGGGRAVPMRQLGSMLDVKPWLKMINVDLLSIGLDDLQPDDLEYLEGLAPGATDPESEPTFIRGSVETVNLPETAHIITAIEVVQYLYDPLRAVANCYNQLADAGILAIAARHNIAARIRYQRESIMQQTETPMKHLLEELGRAGITSAVTYQPNEKQERLEVDPNRWRTLLLQKKPGTILRITKPVVNVVVNSENYKAVYYKAPDDDSSSIVEVALC